MAKVQIALSSGIALTVKGSRKLCKGLAKQLADDAIRLELLSQTHEQFAATYEQCCPRKTAG